MWADSEGGRPGAVAALFAGTRPGGSDGRRPGGGVPPIPGGVASLIAGALCLRLLPDLLFAGDTMANIGPTFADMLPADSEFVMPTSDKDVQAALVSFGAVFKTTRGDTHISERAELLVGLALLHTHHLNLQPLVAALSIAQQQTLATALGLDFQAFGTDASSRT